MSGTHAFLPPSSAAAWVHCALWPTMNRRYPETADKPEALEGEAAHWVFEQMLMRLPVALGQAAPNGIRVAPEMLDGAAIYVDVVAKAYADTRVSHYRVEQRVMIPSVHAENWGTPDTWIFGHNPTTGRARLTVIDYKFGHEYVDVVGNWQLLDYACGILDELQINGLGEQQVDIEFIVVQPRNFHRDGPVQRGTMEATGIRGYRNKLIAGAELATVAQPKASPAPDRCKHCPGRHACDALQREAYSAASLARESVPLDMTPEAASLELWLLQRAKGLLDARVSGLEQQVDAAVRAGHQDPRYMLEDTAGRTKWTVPDREVIELGKAFAVNLAVPATMTPRQAEKVLDPAIVAMYSARQSGGAKLVPRSDSRATRVFGTQP